MTNDHNVRRLSDELRDLADDIAPSASDARDRARLGIARRTRNRRAAVGAGAAVVVIAAVAVIAVDRGPSAARRPAGTTPPIASTTLPSATTVPPTTTPGRVAVFSTIPPVNHLPAATASYRKTFPWGTADSEVAFHTPQGEGVSGGPLAFTADAAGNIVVLDHSSGRIVRLRNGVSSSNPIGMSPAVSAAVFDSEGRVIVATLGDVAVYLPNGALQKDFGTLSTTAIRSLEVIDHRVYAVDANPHQSAVLGTTRRLLLRSNGLEYERVDGAVTEADDVTLDIDPEASRAFTMHVPAGGGEYWITASDAFNAVTSARLLPDGTLAFVLWYVSDGQSPDSPGTYVLGRIDPAGHAQYRTFTASMGYLVNGPEFVIDDDGLAVMSSTTTGGATVSYYPFN